MDEPPRTYDVHGLWLHFVAEGERLARDAEQLLAPFAAQGVGARPHWLIVRYGPPPQQGDAPEGMDLFWDGPLPDGTPMACWTAPGRRRLHMPGLTSVDIDLTHRRAEAVVGRGSEWAFTYGCLIPVLCEFLAEADQHIVHAAALAAEPAEGAPALLLAGRAGAGKTTTALALAGRGMTLMSDDATFLCRAPDGALAVWGLPRAVKVHARSVRMLPWLGSLPSLGSAGNDESWIALGRVSPVDPRRTARPALILLLDGHGAPDHEVAALDPVEAIARMTDENVRAFERRATGAAGRAFTMLGEMIARCRVCSLRLGPDPESLVELVRPMLEGVA